MGVAVSFGECVSGADQAGDRVARLLDLLVGARAALGDGVGDAVPEVLVEQRQGHRLQRPGRGGDLRQDVDAVLVLVDHALQPADLTFDPAQATQVRLFVVGVTVHRRPPGFGWPATRPRAWGNRGRTLFIPLGGSGTRTASPEGGQDFVATRASAGPCGWSGVSKDTARTCQP